MIILTGTGSVIIVDGDLAVLHLNTKANEQNRGRKIYDIFRIEIRKIVEDWDVAQIVPEMNASGIAMF